MKIGICKLCRQEKELLKSSHIIPNFMYNHIYDKNHKLIFTDPQAFAKGTAIVKRPSSGAWESNILCRDCDGRIIQNYENYGKQVLFSKENVPKINLSCKNYVSIDGQEYDIYYDLDYKKFKLFLLTILWRASISSLPYFNEINLGFHDEIIRKMILNDDPKRDENYPIFMFSWLNDAKAKTNFISQPSIGHLNESKWYVFPINGIVYNFYLNVADLNKDLRDFILSESGEMTLFYFEKGIYKNWLKTYHKVSL